MKKLCFRKRLYCSVVALLSLFAACSNNLHAANDSGSGDVLIAASDSPQSLQESKVGMIAPKFTRIIGGKSVNLASFSNQYVVLNFWSSSSQESREVNTAIKKIEKKYPGSKVAFVDISVDENADIAKQYGVSSVPVIYIISPDGCVFDVKKNDNELEQKLNELVK